MVISSLRVDTPRISTQRIQCLYPVVLRDGAHVAQASTLNDKTSNIKVDLLDSCSGQMLADLLFISLVKQRRNQVSMKSMNNSNILSEELSERCWEENGKICEYREHSAEDGIPLIKL